MPEFLQPSFCASEVSVRYTAIKLAVRESQRQYNEGRALFVACDSDSDSMSTSERLAASQIYLQHMRTYGLSLTLAAITNVILRTKKGDGGEGGGGVRVTTGEASSSETPTELQSFIAGITALALQAAKFEPIGAGFIAPFLDAAWAIDEACRASIEAVAASHQIGFTVGRARIFSKRLHGSLDAVRAVAVR